MRQVGSIGLSITIVALFALPALAGRDTSSLVRLSCEAGQIPKHSGNRWQCADDEVASGGAVTPLNECGTIDQPGAYTLTGNLPGQNGLNTDGSCLIVTADFVSIDLAGYTMTGDGTGSGIGTDGTFELPRLGITVRNGTVTGFLSGLLLTRADGSVVANIRAIRNVRDGIVIGRASTVTSNVARNNGGDGINGGDIITGNIVDRNGQVGIFGGRIVTGNSVTRNGPGAGILAVDGSTVSNNAAKFNQGVGISAGSGSTVSGNTSEGNIGSGIQAEFGSTIRSNTAFANDESGIEATCPSNIIENTLTFNGTNLKLDTSLGPCRIADNLAP